MADGGGTGADFAVNLTNCDREPIHVLGTVQPFGFLIALTADWLVSRVSANSAAFIGLSPDDMLGKPVSDLLDADAIHALRNRITLLRGADSVERIFSLPLMSGGAPFDVAVHFSGPLVVIEAEPASADEMEASSTVRSMVARLAQADGMTAFLRDGARQVRALTGFDRVMVYRFADGGDGEVVAEALRPGIDSFFGLHYPASDIPVQARALYLRNIFRVIADVHAQPVPIVPTLDPTGAALDMSLCLTRAVSPIHIEYLRNMGVGASLSISIIVEGRLWGLFACHHYAPRLPTFAQRSAAELFGQIFSMMLESRERAETADYEGKARQVADRLMSAVAQDHDLLSNARWLGDIIFDTIPADGVGVYIDGQISLSGLTPDTAAFAGIVSMLNRVAASQVYTTDALGRVLPEAAAYADRASGLLAIPLSRRPRDYVVLFRAEQLRAVRWAGNQDKHIEYGPNGPRLTPRKSFEEWSELVKGTALPFAPAQLRVAEALRTALLEVVLRLSDSADAERQRAHEKQELLIAELNHRVRNILALIRGLLSQTRSSAVSVEDFIGTLESRIHALARAHDQITADRWSPARLYDLIEVEAGVYLGERRDRVRLSGPNVLLTPGCFTVMALVIHEMLTNAAKYGALSDNGTVTIDWRVDQDGSLLIDWRESGGPVVVAPTRRGFGSTVIERSIPYDLDGRAEIHYRLAGLEAHFCIPSTHVVSVLPDVVGTDRSRPVIAVTPALLKGRHVLLVEDNMIIAMDGEDALRDLGADVTTAATIARAREALQQHPVDLAVLDFNLGAETSMPVADLLAEQGIPFLFATGYGDGLELPDRFADVTLVKKPYSGATLAQAMTPLIGEAA
ncbi:MULTISPECIES: HWE histidine kinase domain-containing protein [unclassified Sphingobium]|uniref:HWE histidine kinase domain-containing protein n=1 Tax=unclassified Sphingobium TaxID=2611147 RepID=UPI000D15FEE6|nr:MULTISPECIES: HWE histidine kinase domain-containing protein [unclassified Sphingobium]MBG6117679.1 light-regulated signal transduction histidine kinase (bacteriophytochrome) [Sphingobium sp. JAI105]PSO12752.1 two-component system sensor histidine kinase/response regulator [Sphingobium sp. AEW4]TWD09951.1 light-regulated signal transduction histidine kinase (bacteriophytochrome) [Sphingobium sp. AEW010]TWD26622.1 light-regulated signal transduction histidine kinase (bacteriophytochrome) [Sph